MDISHGYVAWICLDIWWISLGYLDWISFLGYFWISLKDILFCPKISKRYPFISNNIQWYPEISNDIQRYPDGANSQMQWYILFIYQTYTCVCKWYSMYLLLFSGFHGTHCSPAPQSHGIEDNTQEAHDDANCNIPDTQAVLERFMFNMSAGYDEQGRFASGQFG